MRQYSTSINLTRNSRGVYSLDPLIGCSSGMAETNGGCYHDCYAANAAARYGYDFTKSVRRDFENEYHRRQVMSAINRSSLDFIRMGTSCDPSEDWDHTMNIIDKIKNCNKNIVIITKHWNNMTDKNAAFIKGKNICINTSVSALDSPRIYQNGIEQYHRLKPVCKSVLRVVTADFTSQSDIETQEMMLSHNGAIDTVLRVKKNNPHVLSGRIKTQVKRFLGTKMIVSKHKPSIYMGHCSTCREMCGVNVNVTHPKQPGITKQTTLF